MALLVAGVMRHQRALSVVLALLLRWLLNIRVSRAVPLHRQSSYVRVTTCQDLPTRTLSCWGHSRAAASGSSGKTFARDWKGKVCRQDRIEVLHLCSSTELFT